MMFEETVSVILATYNGGKFLRHQLDSLLKQELQPFEIIVCDDHSSDNTLEIINEFSRSSAISWIVSANQHNTGPTANFLKMAKLAKGRFIAFCDQDDYWMPNKLKVCVDEMNSSGALLVGHSVALMNKDGQNLGVWNQGIGFKNRAYFRGDPWTNFLGMSMVFDRKLVDLIDQKIAGGILNPHSGLHGMSHDQWFDFIADSLNSIHAIKTPLASYRLHENNVSGVNTDLAKRRVQLKIEAGFAARPGRKLSQAALQRSEILEELATEAKDEVTRLKLASAARKWKKLAQFEGRRELIYKKTNLSERVGIFLSLIGAGAYRDWSNHGAGKLVSLKDLVSGVVRI